MVWHQKLHHISGKGMQVLSKKNQFGGDYIENIGFCEHCVLAISVG